MYVSNRLLNLIDCFDTPGCIFYIYIYLFLLTTNNYIMLAQCICTEQAFHKKNLLFLFVFCFSKVFREFFI